MNLFNIITRPMGLLSTQFLCAIDKLRLPSRLQRMGMLSNVFDNWHVLHFIHCSRGCQKTCMTEKVIQGAPITAGGNVRIPDAEHAHTYVLVCCELLKLDG